MKKTAKPRISPYEVDEQEALAQYLDLKGFLWDHNAKERMAPVQWRVQEKRLGSKKGFPDVFIADRIPNQKYSWARGVFIELKRRDMRKSELKDEQKWWLRELAKRGYIVFVAKGATRAIWFLEKILGF